jgi:ribosomal protein S3
MAEAMTTYGVIGVKCWVYNGEILEQKKRPEKPAVVPAPVESAPAPAPAPTV